MQPIGIRVRADHGSGEQWSKSRAGSPQRDCDRRSVAARLLSAAGSDPAPNRGPPPVPDSLPPPVDVKTREARAVQLASQLEIDTDWGSSPPSVAATCGGRWAGVCRCHSVSGLSRGLQTGTQDFLMAPGPRVGPGPPIQHRARAYWAQSAPGQGKLAHGWAIRFAPVLRVGTGPGRPVGVFGAGEADKPWSGQ